MLITGAMMHDWIEQAQPNQETHMKIEFPYTSEIDVVKLERLGYQLTLDNSILRITASSLWGEEAFDSEFRIHAEGWIGRKAANAAMEEAAAVLNNALFLAAMRKAME